jgi:hypothetical protein
MTLDLSDEEKLAQAGLLKCAIADDPFPLSPRVRMLEAILAKLELPPAVAAKALPASKPGDRPRAALVDVLDCEIDFSYHNTRRRDRSARERTGSHARQRTEPIVQASKPLPGSHLAVI